MEILWQQTNRAFVVNVACIAILFLAGLAFLSPIHALYFGVLVGSVASILVYRLPFPLPGSAPWRVDRSSYWWLPIIVSACAFMAAFGVVIDVLRSPLIVVAVICLAVFIEREGDGPRWRRVLVCLPLGVGTLLGSGAFGWLFRTVLYALAIVYDALGLTYLVTKTDRYAGARPGDALLLTLSEILFVLVGTPLFLGIACFWSLGLFWWIAGPVLLFLAPPVITCSYFELARLVAPRRIE